ncbi:hypothetical protein CJF60_00760 [Mycoplasmopsis agassizii]|uniref:Uncharacterized protein n=2 Tax=Mycoplasmopsis agassizii TaxID=33922 RepID=A0ABX4H5N8_9BACT|nr:hypothetical protein CJF60_00760 [Mycoplasmopsis agassizii]
MNFLFAFFKNRVKISLEILIKLKEVKMLSFQTWNAKLTLINEFAKFINTFNISANTTKIDNLKRYMVDEEKLNTLISYNFLLNQ